MTEQNADWINDLFDPQQATTMDTNNVLSKANSQKQSTKPESDWFDSLFNDVKIDENKNQDNDTDEKKIDHIVTLKSNINIEFDYKIFKLLIEASNKKSLIISPFSILTASTLCMLGASDNTLKEMINSLYPNIQNKQTNFNNCTRITLDILKLCDYYNNKYTDSPIIKVANKLFVNKKYKILNKYINILKNNIDGIGSFNANKPQQTSNIINKWCSNNTNKMIKEILKPNDIKPSIRLFIANAIYFDGKFIIPFKKELTEKNINFYSSKDKENIISKISMMYSFDNHYFIKNYNKQYDIVKLQYKKCNYSICLIIVINNKSNNSNECLLKTNEIKQLQFGYPKLLYLYLPKFKFEFKIILNNVLQQIGIKDAFNKHNANFSNLSSSNLFIGRVIHKAVIDIDEEGTKAAAVTVIEDESESESSIDKPKIIRFDYPFTFYIFDSHKNIVLFCGKFCGS